MQDGELINQNASGVDYQNRTKYFKIKLQVILSSCYIRFFFI